MVRSKRLYLFFYLNLILWIVLSGRVKNKFMSLQRGCSWGLKHNPVNHKYIY